MTGTSSDQRRTKTTSGKSKSSSLRVTKRADGSSKLIANGPVVTAAIFFVAVLGLLLIAPQIALAMGAVVGAILGFSLYWFIWALVTGRIIWGQIWNDSMFQAIRKKDGTLDLHGIGGAAWPLAGLLAILVYYLFAPEDAWSIWAGFGGAALVSAVANILMPKGKQTKSPEPE